MLADFEAGSAGAHAQQGERKDVVVGSRSRWGEAKALRKGVGWAEAEMAELRGEIMLDTEVLKVALQTVYL